MRKFRTNSTDMNVKEEMSSSDESGDEFVPDVRPSQTPSIYHLVPDMKIKLEVVDLHRNSTDDYEYHSHLDLDTIRSIQLYVDCDSAKFNDFYSDLSHCEENCETCQKYTKTLLKHVRSGHPPPQPTHDPLHIDPTSTGHDSPQGDIIQIKCEVAEHIDQKDCPQEMDFQHISASGTEDDRDLKPASVTGAIIPQIYGNNSITIQQKDMNHFNIGFLQSVGAEDCETCQKYLRMLSEHAGATHEPSLPIREPLLIDPLNIDPDLHHAEQSSTIEIKYEVHDGIETMECSEQESESNDPDFALESGSESERDYSLSPRLTRNVHRQYLPKKLSTDSTSLVVRERKNQFKCNQCGKRLTTKRDLTVHMRTHTGERPYKCDVCENSFSVKTNLTEHKRIHTGERPYQCDVCVKCFSTMRNLVKHKITHTGEKLHKCHECEQSFSRSSDLTNLTEHKRVHTGERPYQCDVCEMSFSVKRYLVTHTRESTLERDLTIVFCVRSVSPRRVL